MAVDLSPLLTNIVGSKTVMIAAVLAVFASIALVVIVLKSSHLILAAIRGDRIFLGQNFTHVDWLIKMYDLEKDLRDGKRVDRESLRAYRAWVRETTPPRRRRRSRRF